MVKNILSVNFQISNKRDQNVCIRLFRIHILGNVFVAVVKRLRSRNLCIKWHMFSKKSACESESEMLSYVTKFI